MTDEQKRISNRNHKKAIKYFEWIGLLPKDREPYVYNLHHINPDWKENDVERYIKWDPNDLEVLTRSEHTRLHNLISRDYSYQCGTNSVWYGKHMWGDKPHPSTGIHRCGENHPMYGKHHSEESKEKMRQAQLGKHLSEETKAKISEKGKGNKSTKGQHWKLVDGKRIYY